MGSLRSIRDGERFLPQLSQLLKSIPLGITVIGQRGRKVSQKGITKTIRARDKEEGIKEAGFFNLYAGGQNKNGQNHLSRRQTKFFPAVSCWQKCYMTAPVVSGMENRSFLGVFILYLRGKPFFVVVLEASSCPSSLHILSLIISHSRLARVLHPPQSQPVPSPNLTLSPSFLCFLYAQAPSKLTPAPSIHTL